MFKEAEKKDIKLKLGVSSLSGGGKTISSLLIMKGLLSKIEDLGIIQTENGRAQFYIDRIGKFKVLEITPPFSPDKFIEAIDMAEKSGLKALIIDSMSDQWAGLGGLLDVHQGITDTVRNSFSAWKKANPMHEAVFTRILSSPLHIIATFKKKADYVMENVNGKQAPKKVGLADVAREGTEYRWALQFDLDRESHKASVVKDNMGLFEGSEPFLITEDTGRKIREWILK